MSTHSGRAFGTPSTISLEGFNFAFVESLAPERYQSGAIEEYSPQRAYARAGSVPLHKYGHGTFCRFHVDVPKDLGGVYALVVAGSVRYVGECTDLKRQFNIGYGRISPSACYEGGQRTHCKINHHVLAVSQAGGWVDLYFHPTSQSSRPSVKKQLIARHAPLWNGRTP